MEYDEAYRILDTNADPDKLFLFILKGDNKSAIEYVKQITNCDEIIAKAIILDLSDGLVTENTNKLNNNQTNSFIQSNIPKCPKCGSTSITTGARGVNFTWGLIGASKTVNRCSNCGHTWKPKK